MASGEVRSHKGVSGEEESDYRLHRAAFYGNVSEVKDLLEKENLEPSAPDKHGKIRHMECDCFQHCSLLHGVII